MKLIFIYGPPAVGKLTVAELVSENTGIALFHNHLTRDLVSDIYKDSVGEHYDLVRQLRLDVIEYCASNDTDLLFTYVYGGPADDPHVRSIINKTAENGGDVIFIELTADKEDLLHRVSEESRKKYNKISEKNILEKLIDDVPTFSIPFVKKTVISTSELTPELTATKIKELL